MSTDKATKTVSKKEESLHCTDDARSYFTEDGLNKLKANLGRTAAGQPKIFTAPFARKGNDEEIPMDQVIGEWRDTLVSIADQWPTLLEFEDDLAAKVGPLSIELPIEERMSDIALYYSEILLPSTPISPSAIYAVIKEFAGVRGMHQRSLKDTFIKMKKSSSAGSPTMGKRRDFGQEQITSRIFTNPLYYDTRVTYGCNNPIDGKRNYDLTAIVGWRGQEGGPEPKDVKQRVIWMFPFVLNLHELSVYQPLIEGAQKLDLVPAWVSMDDVDRHITMLFDTKSPKDLIVSTDFSKFDQHFNPHMWQASRSILEAILHKNGESKRWLHEVFLSKYVIPLTYGVDGHVLYMFGNSMHGMASGSGGTNADETLAHRALQYEAAILNGSRLNPHSMCLGDDGILTYPGITVDDVVEVYESHGQECNKTKQYASSQDCIYLRRWHHKDYRINEICAGVYSTCRALGKLRYLERYMDPEFWSKEMVAIRQLSIIENCKYHPLFREFIDFCMKRDKYRLGLDIPGFLQNLGHFAKMATDYNEDFLGYTKTLQGETVEGIENWEVVKYLKSKS